MAQSLTAEMWMDMSEATQVQLNTEGAVTWRRSMCTRGANLVRYLDGTLRMSKPCSIEMLAA
jgi:hypothetical protein